MLAYLRVIVEEVNRADPIRPESAVDKVSAQLYVEPLVSQLVEKIRGELEGGRNALRQARLTQEALQE